MIKIDGLTIEKIEDVTKADITKYTYAYVTYLSSVKIGENNAPLDFDELLEAWLFDENKSLHIYRDDGGRLRGINIVEEALTNFVDSVISISSALCKNGEKMVERKYIGYDEDGQANIVLTRPIKFE